MSRASGGVSAAATAPATIRSNGAKRLWALFVVSIHTFSAATAKDSLVLLPPQIQLTGPAAAQRLLIERKQDGQFSGPISDAAEFTSSDEGIVRLTNGIAFPVTNGQATISVRVGKDVAQAAVQVTGMDRPFVWSFRNHVQPVLAKFSCSSGACHGAAAGQNGFKLSLRGFDDEGDFRALTRHAVGRRIVPTDPARSLLLLKPTGALPHKGGTRFETDSLEYRVLSEWIAQGTPAPKPADPRIQNIEIFPAHAILAADAIQPLLVLAHFSDGTVQDVTRWAKYTDANAAVTAVNDTGVVKVQGYGEGAVTAWCLSKIAVATITVPYTNRIDPSLFTLSPQRNFIDAGVMEKLRALNLPPSPRCNEAEFLRRAFLDTIGTLPTLTEARLFLADSSPTKRDALIESLLQRDEFIDFWSYKWSDLLLVNSDRLRPSTTWSYYRWIRQNVAANTPWDKLVRAILTAEGSTLENGAANFFSLHEDPLGLAETSTQAFLGMSINCARCHNHPLEKWTNDEYFGFANLFARVRQKSGAGDGEKIVFEASDGDVDQPLRGRPQPPRPLDGQPISLQAPGNRRETVAAWLTARENPYFTRAIVNRVWANFFGSGLVQKVDDLRQTNPSSNESLLSHTAEFLADHHFDLKALMRAILQSETYQRSSEALPENAADNRFYSHFYPKRLMAEVLLDAYSQVTGVPTEFRVDLRNQNQGLGSKYPLGLRAQQLPDTKTFSYFLKTFGRPEREKTCECERTAEPSITQVLHLANGDTVNQKLASSNNVIRQQIASQVSRPQLLEDAYLAALARRPSASEREKIEPLLVSALESDLRSVVEDLYWALFTSREFLFNH